MGSFKSLCKAHAKWSSIMSCSSITLTLVCERQREREREFPWGKATASLWTMIGGTGHGLLCLSHSMHTRSLSYLLSDFFHLLSQWITLLSSPLPVDSIVPSGNTGPSHIPHRHKGQPHTPKKALFLCAEESSLCHPVYWHLTDWQIASASLSAHLELITCSSDKCHIFPFWQISQSHLLALEGSSN